MIWIKFEATQKTEASSYYQNVFYNQIKSIDKYYFAKKCFFNYEILLIFIIFGQIKYKSPNFNTWPPYTKICGSYPSLHFFIHHIWGYKKKLIEFFPRKGRPSPFFLGYWETISINYKFNNFIKLDYLHIICSR